MPINANTFVSMSQTKGGKCLIRFNGTSANVIVAANSTVNSDLSGISNNNDQILSASISGIWFSVLANSTGGGVTIQRANNSVTANLVNLCGTDHWTQSDGWRSNYEFATQNVIVSFSAGASGTVIIEFTKQYAAGGGESQFYT